MNKIITKSKKLQSLNVVYPFFTLILLLAQLYCVYSYVMGAAPIFGTTISVTSSVEMIFGLLYLKGSWYRGLVSAGFGIAYLAILVAMAKNLICSIPFIKKLFSKEMCDVKTAKKVIIAYGSTTGKNFLLYLAFMLCCNTVQGFMLPEGAVSLVAIWAAIWLFTRILYAIVDGYRIDSLLIKCLYDLVATVPVLVLLYLIRYPSFEQIIYLCKGLLISPVYCLVGMITPIIYFIMLVFALRSWFDINESLVLQSYESRYSVKVLLGLSISLGVASIVNYVVCGYDARLDFDKIIEFFIPYLPIILLSGALFVASVLPFDFLKKITEDDKNADKYTIDDRGNLTILSDVVEIKPGAFEYRKDIKVVNIPTSVGIIGVNAFNGCTELKQINCDHSEKVSGWVEGWDNGCSASVHWKPQFVQTVVNDPTPKAAPVATPQVVVQPAIQVVVQPASQVVAPTEPLVVTQPEPVVVVQQPATQPAPQVITPAEPAVEVQPESVIEAQPTTEG